MQILTQIFAQIRQRFGLTDGPGELVVQRQQIALLEPLERDGVAERLAAHRIVDALVVRGERHREPARLSDAQPFDGVLDRIQQPALAQDEDGVHHRFLDRLPLLLHGVVDRDLVTFAGIPGLWGQLQPGADLQPLARGIDPRAVRLAQRLQELVDGASSTVASIGSTRTSR